MVEHRTTTRTRCTDHLVGRAVFTADGRRLGRVKRASERCVEVDARFAFDYWLSSRAIAAVEDGHVLLGIDKAQVGTYLVDPDCIEDEHLAPAAGPRLALATLTV